MPTVSVLIVNYNAGERIVRCLEALGAQTFTDFEIVLLDNASADGSLALARAAAPAAIFLPQEVNLGFAAGNNLAATRAGGEWLAFLNPDAYPEPDWLEALMAARTRHPGVDAFGSAQIAAESGDRIDGAGDVLHAFGIPYRGGFGAPVSAMPPEGEVFAPCAAAALYRTSTFRSLGGFDERFFCYGEDVDLGFRLRLAGGRVVQVPGAVVLHEGSGISGRHSAFSVYHGNRNRIWLTYKSMPRALYWPLVPFRLLTSAVLLLKALRSGYGRAYLRGLVAGLRGIPRFAADRRALRAARAVGTRDVARFLCWSPGKLLHRGAKWW